MQITTKFTPGPWEWRNGRLFRSYPETFASVNIFVIHDDRWMPRPDDAHLIAAAPELYEALREAVEEIESLRNYANGHGAMIDDENCDYGRAALAKARGEA